MKSLSGTTLGGVTRPDGRRARTGPHPYLYRLGALLLLGPWVKAPAQTYMERYYVPEQHVHWHMDAGYVATTGQIADLLDGGWTVGGGLSWQPDFSVPLALRADLNYSYFGATRQLIGMSQAPGQAWIDDGYGETIDLAVDGEYRLPLSPYVTGFAVAGGGVAHRRIALTQTVPVGGYFCDPWWGFCGYGVVPGSLVVSSDNTTRFAWNAGLGLDIALSNDESFFVEARFTRIETSPPTDFVPIRVGVRF